MKTFIVTVKKRNKVAFTKELLSSLDFLDIKQEKKLTVIEKKNVAKYKKAFQEINNHVTGKKKLQTAKEFLKEI
jgi:isocitrate/isopropylmalate dehydrogenase